LVWLWRFFIEGLRTDSLTLGNLRISQVVAILAFAVCTALLVYFNTKTKKQTETLPYEAMFAEEMEEETIEEFEECEETETVIEETEEVKITEE